MNQQIFNAFHESGIILIESEFQDLLDNLEKQGYEIRQKISWYDIQKIIHHDVLRQRKNIADKGKFNSAGTTKLIEYEIKGDL